MYNRLVPHIPEGAKVIIGLGDSFTQGVGSWETSTYLAHNNHIDIHNIPSDIIDEMYENSWVHQLCKNHLPEYIPVNFGMMGNGNRAAVKELYLNPLVNLKNASKVTVVYMLSGLERFDFVNNAFPEHHHFYTMWPNYTDKNSTNPKLWKLYATTIWSDKFSIVEGLLNIKEAEMFCKANNYDLVITNAFDNRVTKDNFMSMLGSTHRDLINSIPWDKFLYPKRMKSFIELLTAMDGRPSLGSGGFFPYYTNLPAPTKYITNCAHPSKEGHRVIADTIYKFIKNQGYIDE